MTWVLILAVGLAAGTLGGIVGFGSSIILMPVLVLTVGPKETVPLMAIAGLMANLSRVAVWWRVVDWAAAAAFSATAVPAAALGARTLIALDPRVVEATLGGFFLLMIPIRRWLLARGLRIGLWHLALVGAGIGFMSGIVATIGPVNTPFFLAYGLVKGAYLSTEALGSAAMGISKAVVFRTFGAMPLETLLHGLIIGASLTAGSWLAKRFVMRMDSYQFRHVMDALLAISGLVMLCSALT
ncbi:MAG: sulfite exporter TauE/SafE family protein [Hyphomicrobiaceae bacterium]